MQKSGLVTNMSRYYDVWGISALFAFVALFVLSILSVIEAAFLFQIHSTALILHPSVWLLVFGVTTFCFQVLLSCVACCTRGSCSHGSCIPIGYAVFTILWLFYAVLVWMSGDFDEVSGAVKAYVWCDVIIMCLSTTLAAIEILRREHRVWDETEVLPTRY
jgi:hypothetical protein